MIRSGAVALIVMGFGVYAGAQDLEGLKLDKDPRGSAGLESYQFTYKFSPDKEPIKGLLLKPAGKGPFPAVVVNHGKGGMAEGFVKEFGSIFAAKGYVAIGCVLTHAGKGEGEPRTFAASKENAERIMAAIKILESLPYVEAKKLCMFGHSMGAFATVGTCTQTDKIRVAAITAGGLRNRDGLDTDENAAKISAAFLILHGTADQTVRVELGKALKAALDKHKKTSELKLFEGIGHDLPRLKKDEVFEKILPFFESHLK